MDILLLVHGTLAMSNQLEKLGELLSHAYNIELVELQGHGKSVSQNFGMDVFADDVINKANEFRGKSVHVFGYSMGGYAALLAALNSPEVISKIITLGTKFDWNPQTASGEVRMLNPHKMQEKIPHFVKHLEDSHPRGWQTLVEKTATMMTELGANPPLTKARLANLHIPVKIIVGERDSTAGVESSRDFASAISSSEFLVLDEMPHPIEKVDMKLLSNEILGFLSAGSHVKETEMN